LDTTALDGYSAVTQSNNGLATGRPAYNQGEVAVPFGTPVPEPSTAGLVLVGLVGAALRARRGHARA
jgi:PEP-CTERM motif-containing protein